MIMQLLIVETFMLCVSFHQVRASDRLAYVVDDDRHNPNVTPKGPTPKPSTAPIRKPTFRPSLKPVSPTKLTNSPTSKRVPTKKPSAKPSKRPSSKPITARPNAWPTAKPMAKTTQPIVSPILQPTKKPTKKPTKRPSSKPTIIRTSSARPSAIKRNTSGPSNAAVKPVKACQTQTGSFGQFTNNPVTVTYNYRMDLSTATPDQAIQSVEVAVSNAVVTSLIPACSGISSNFFMSKATTTSSSQVTGVSSLPKDRITANTACSSSISPTATKCFLVEGKITVYLPMIRLRYLSSDDVYMQTSNAIEYEMNSGALVQSTNGVVNLSYLNDGSNSGMGQSTLPPLYGTNTTTVTVTGGSGGNGSSSPIAWALIGAFGGVFALAALAFAHYKRRQKKKQLTQEPKSNVVSLDDDNTFISSSPIRRGMIRSDASSVDDTKTGGRYW